MSIELSRKFSFPKSSLPLLSDIEMSDIDRLTELIGADSNNGFAIFADGHLVGYASDIRLKITRVKNANKTKNPDYQPETEDEVLKEISQFATDNPTRFYADGLALVSRLSGARYVFVRSSSNKLHHALSVVENYIIKDKAVKVLEPKYRYIKSKPTYTNPCPSLFVRPLSLNDFFNVAKILDVKELVNPDRT